MLAKVVTFTLISIITGSLVDDNTKLLDDALLSYLSLLSGSTKDSSSSQVSLSDFSSLLDSTLTLGEEEKSVYAQLLNKVSFFAKTVYEQATKDSEKLQLELEQLKIKLIPYSKEVTKLLSKTTEELEITLNPYADELQTQVEKITLEFIKKLKSFSLDLKLPLVLYFQTLDVRMAECLNALRSAVATCTEKVKETIDLQVAALYQSLSPFAEEMQDALRKQLGNLNFSMKKSVILIGSKILENTSMLEKEMSLCISQIKEKKGSLYRNVRYTVTSCLVDLSQKIKMFNSVMTPFGETLTKSVVFRIENIQNLLQGSAAVNLQNKKDILEKSIFDTISNFINNSTLLTNASVTE
ncbi:apolipoprotein A-IV-like [Ranitomeya imitator]|uniref:apolipoprotein A-IV-like n=1 Tax=Ranitomeya imitator TaxID=111125 RepID=UPI0037E8680B